MINYKAISYMVLSAVAFTLLNSCVRYVDYLPTFELVFFRAIGSMVCGLLFLTSKRIPVLGNNKKILLLRGVVGVTAMSLFYKAFQMMPMASVVSLRYLSPFFAAALAILLLGEKMNRLQWFFFCTAFMGVVLLKGFDHRISMLALAVILSSAFLSGLVYVIIRKIGESEHPVVVVTYLMTVATTVGGLMCLFNWITPQGIEWLILLFMGLSGFVAQVLMTKALQIAEANLIVPFKYSEVVFTLLVGWIIFGEHQTGMALLGMGVIVVSLLGNVLMKG